MTKKKRLWFLLPALAALLIPSLAFASEELPNTFLRRTLPSGHCSPL